MNEDEHKDGVTNIFGKKLREQARLLRLARKESSEWKKVELTREHYHYLFEFFKKHIFLVAGLLALLFSQGVIESGLIIFSRDQISHGTRLWLSSHFITLFSVLIVVFLINSFFAIKYERSFIVLLTNNIRRRIFKHFLGRSLQHASSDQHAHLIAKISYHVPLVTLGISNSFFGLWRWLMYLGIVIMISSISHYRVLTVGGIFILTSVALFFGGYVVSRFYVSQEVTFYSKIIKEIDFNTTNLSFLKIFGQERRILQKFDKLVWLDSFFRVRRDIWMRLGFKMVFILLTIVSIFSHFFPTRLFSFLGTGNTSEQFLFILLLIYFSRALNEATRAGLYLFPARLGLFLTILPSGKNHAKDTGFSLEHKTLGFHSHKMKLFRQGEYHRNMRFDFAPGERVLFVGDNMMGKTSLAKVFAGMTAYNPRAIKITIDSERFEFAAWQSLCSGVYFFDPHFRVDYTLMECIMGKVTDDITIEEFAEALTIMNRYPSIVELVSTDGNYTIPATAILQNPLQAFALHTLHCLVKKYPVLIIDNMWIDVQYSRIFDMIRVLDQALPSSIMLVFSHSINDYIAYTQRYELNTKIRPAS